MALIIESMYISKNITSLQIKVHEAYKSLLSSNQQFYTLQVWLAESHQSRIPLLSSLVCNPYQILASCILKQGLYLQLQTSVF